MYDANQIANWFLNAVDRDAGDSITHLKLQKLVYYAQAWALALLGRPLFEEDFQAWAHGPVVPSLWHRFKDSGWEAIPAAEDATDFDLDEELLLRDVLVAYGEHSAKALEDLTHDEEPWKMARGGLPPEMRSSAVIPKSVMREYYGKVYQEVTERPAE
jgi:uncharacterized phage-associated protein